MAKRLFSQGNYVIAEIDGIFREYQKNIVRYETTETSDYRLIQYGVDELLIENSDVVNWYTSESGDTFYTESTLIQFLRGNTNYIEDSAVKVEVNQSDIGEVPCGIILSVDVNDGTDPVMPTNVQLNGDTLEISVPSGNNLTSAKILKTFETNTYRPNDDGNLQLGREVDYLTLNYINPFGNTTRWTDLSGGTTYADNILIDWSTFDDVSVLGYYRVSNAPANLNDTISWASGLTVAGFSGWHLTNWREMLNTTKSVGTAILTNQIPPFNLPAALYWTNSGTGATTSWIFGNYLGSPLQNGAEGSLYRGVACRYFTVTGTTLT